MELVIPPLTKAHGGSNGEPRFVLRVPAFSLAVPSVVFVMGHNGAGKSVLLKLLAGEEQPSAAPIQLMFGEKKWSPEHEPSPIVRQNVEQNLALDLSVRENLALHLKVARFAEMARPLVALKAQIEVLVNSHSELRRKLDQPCRYLSGGQKQALGFIAITSRKLPLLLLDEFLGATDQATSKFLLGLVFEYVQKTPACALIASHDVQLALAHGNRIIVLNSGEISKDVWAGSPDWNESTMRETLVQH